MYPSEEAQQGRHRGKWYEFLFFYDRQKRFNVNAMQKKKKIQGMRHSQHTYIKPKPRT
jgi:hypothetical protein